jgi:hexosaminidase
MKKIFIVVAILMAAKVSAQFRAKRSPEISIIPQPARIDIKAGSFELNRSTVIALQDIADRSAADLFNDYLQQFYGLKLTVVKSAKNNCIRLTTPTFIKAPDNEERYTLHVSPGEIAIQGDSHKGTFYGMQTLLQLLPLKISASGSLFIRAVTIEDQPRFSYRGMHLDVGRHFFPVTFIKKYIDYLALHKFNTFHWHLTEDQGWRIEIKKYPKLTSVGGWRNGTIIGRYPGNGNDSIRYGGFYTQDEIKDVVKYAADRFITIIPEIEMPGHSSAAIAAYPELSCFPGEDTKVAKGTAWAGPAKGKQVQQAWGVFEDVFCAGKESTFQMLEDVLDEVMQLFPSKYIHIGGDECPKANWKRCRQCQQRIKKQGLKDEHELQSYFIQRIEKYLNSKGRNIIGWDEILEGGLAPNATVMSWRGEQGGIEAAKQNHDVMMTPQGWCYFDHSQSRNEDSVTIGGYTPLEKVYGYDPLPKDLSDEQLKHILGAQANVWTEYMANTGKVEYMIFPRMAALSEVLWTAKEKKDSSGFERRLETQFKRYDLWKVNYSKAFWDIHDEILPTADNNGVLWKLSAKKDAELTTFTYKYDTSATGWVAYPPPTDPYKTPILIRQSTIAFAGIYSRVELINIISKIFLFNKATGKKITTSIPPSPTYPGNGGAFGLVNGVRADKFASPEWLGWNGKPVELTIDLGKTDTVKEVVLHAWKQEPSWIYLPVSFEVTLINDNGQEQKFTAEQPASGWTDERNLKLQFAPSTAKTIRIKVNPLMIIPEGNAGAGHAAWIFLDEVEIN